MVVTSSIFKGRITLERRGVPKYELTFRGEESGPWTLVGPGMTSDGKFASQGYRETGVQGDAF